MVVVLVTVLDELEIDGVVVNGVTIVGKLWVVPKLLEDGGCIKTGFRVVVGIAENGLNWVMLGILFDGLWFGEIWAEVLAIGGLDCGSGLFIGGLNVGLKKMGWGRWVPKIEKIGGLKVWKIVVGFIEVCPGLTWPFN